MENMYLINSSSNLAVAALNPIYTPLPHCKKSCLVNLKLIELKTTKKHFKTTNVERNR